MSTLEHIKRDLARAGPGVQPLLCEEDVRHLPALSGAYVLIVKLKHELHVDRPRYAPYTLVAGWYVYTGSARGPGGIRARLARHFRKNKRRHWHIDQLTLAPGAQIWASPAPEGNECDLVANLIRSGLFHTPCPGFGSTDCRKCEAHLLVWRPKA